MLILEFDVDQINEERFIFMIKLANERPTWWKEKGFCLIEFLINLNKQKSGKALITTVYGHLKFKSHKSLRRP